jgi:hypothetical protein
MFRIAASLVILVGLMLSASMAEAGGWTGGDSSSLRANLKQGQTLKKVYTYLDDR